MLPTRVIESYVVAVSRSSEVTSFSSFHVYKFITTYRYVSHFILEEKSGFPLGRSEFFQSVFLLFISLRTFAQAANSSVFQSLFSSFVSSLKPVVSSLKKKRKTDTGSPKTCFPIKQPCFLKHSPHRSVSSLPITTSPQWTTVCSQWSTKTALTEIPDSSLSRFFWIIIWLLQHFPLFCESVSTPGFCGISPSWGFLFLFLLVMFLF